MINFCHGFLKPAITCDKVCADEHGVENLISVDYWPSRRGFRAESFIVPPVSVTVRFPCNIQIACILLDPVVGRQKSTGFEIFACSRKINRSWPSDTRMQPALDEQEIFGPIGKEILREPCVVCFENPSFIPRSPFDTFRGEGPRGGKQSILRNHRKASLSSVSAVTIRIVNTVERSAPALKRLEIWGQPALSTPNQVQTIVYQLFREAVAARSSGLPEPERDRYSANQNRSLHSSIHTTNNSSSSTTTVSSSGTHRTVHQSSVVIPDEFMDPITCDIMTVPLTLPSGKTIDQLTLDKHINAEATWGRPPSDPFTGVPFCELKKPIPNVSLKLRIDQFVLKHSSELKTVPRVLGRGEKTSSAHRLAHGNEQRCAELEYHQASSSGAEPGTSSRDEKLQLKRKHVESGDVETHKKKVVKLAAFNTKGNPHTKPKNHETDLSQSLDAALQAALGGLPSFQTARPRLSNEAYQPDSNPSASDYSCIFCSKTSASHTLYTLACEHFSCRNCLTNALNASSFGSCQGCGKKFLSKDVIRLNI